MYELVSINALDGANYVIRREDEDGKVWFIPVDKANVDYQQYLIDTDGGLPLPKEAK